LSNKQDQHQYTDIALDINCEAGSGSRELLLGA
jgi:hypothetical protein